MIINIRGTHGAGKTTVVRETMRQYANQSPMHLSGRTRPVGYLLEHSPIGLRDVFVTGSYENATGGCDTISKIEVIFDQIKRQAAERDVLFEGILAQHSLPRLVEASKITETHVIVLDTPLEVCIASVQARRNERGDTRPLNTSNIEKEHKSVLSALRRLRLESGIKTHHVGRQAALELTIDLLKKSLATS